MRWSRLPSMGSPETRPRTCRPVLFRCMPGQSPALETRPQCRMSWARLDDQMPDHPKFLQAGDFAPLLLALYVRAVCYSSRYLTDGFIPSGAVTPLLQGYNAWGHDTVTGDGFAFAQDGDEFDWPAIMVHAGLWESCDGGYRIHDYLDYNPTRAQVLERRADSAKRQKKHRDTAVSNDDGNALRHGVSHRPVTSSPAPTPTPITTKRVKAADAAHTQFTTFWEAYPRRAGGNPRNAARRAWEARVASGVSPETLVAAAGRYRAFCEATGKIGTEYVKQAQFWLSPSFEGWVQAWEVPEMAGIPPRSEMDELDAWAAKP